MNRTREQIEDLIAQFRKLPASPDYPALKIFLRDVGAVIRSSFDDPDWMLNELKSIKFYQASLVPGREHDQSKRWARGMREMEGFLDTLRKEAERRGQPIEKAARSSESVNNRKVFVVHGRNDRLRRAMFGFLRSIGLDPIEWSQAVQLTGEGSPYVGEILDAAFNNAQAVVVLLTPDDEARLLPQFQHSTDPAHEKELTPQARPNVIFEAGLGMGRHEHRTILVEVGTLRPFSDMGGRHVIKMDNSIAKRQGLAERLRTAGCAVDLTGTDWHSEGDFRIQVISEGGKISPPPASTGDLEEWIEGVAEEAFIAHIPILEVRNQLNRMSCQGEVVRSVVMKMRQKEKRTG